MRRPRFSVADHKLQSFCGCSSLYSSGHLQHSHSSLASCILLAAIKEKKKNKRKQKREFASSSHSYRKAGRACNQLLPSWDAQHFRQKSGPACSPSPACALTTWANLAETHPGMGRNLPRANPNRTVVCACSSHRVLLSAGLLS